MNTLEVEEGKMKIVKVSGRSPYDELYCPFCGESISHPDRSELGDCPHLVAAFLEDEMNPKDFKENDICFELFEPAPAARSHFFIFRS